MSDNVTFISVCPVTRGRTRDIVCNGSVALAVFRLARYTTVTMKEEFQLKNEGEYTEREVSGAVGDYKEK